MQGNPALLCMRDDWTTYSRVAFDVTTLLASGPKHVRFSAFDVIALHHYPEAPYLAWFRTKPEVPFHVLRRLNRG